MWQEVASYFIKLGCLGFGGPLALVGSMHKDLVEKRRWISHHKFNQAFSFIKAMPGPLAFQMAVYLGRTRAGIKGGFAAGFCLVFPAFLMILLLGIFYQQLSLHSWVQQFMLGMQLAALSIITASLYNLIKPYWRRYTFWILVVWAAILAVYYPSFEPFVIIVSGIVVVLFHDRSKIYSILPLPFFLNEEILKLIWICFKAGAFVFGTGLAIVPMLEHDVVERLHWLTHIEFMNALAFGQITPGPVVITATYIGLKVAGLSGAILGTAAIFAPSFFHMMTWFPHAVNVLGRFTWIHAFILGAIAAVVGSIAITVFRLGIALQPSFSLVIFAFLLFLLALWNKFPAWTLIPIGGIITLLIHQV